MENFLPFTEDVMVVLVHKCAQQTHLLALHLETLGYIPRLLNALNGLATLQGEHHRPLCTENINFITSLGTEVFHLAM